MKVANNPELSIAVAYISTFFFFATHKPVQCDAMDHTRFCILQLDPVLHVSLAALASRLIQLCFPFSPLGSHPPYPLNAHLKMHHKQRHFSSIFKQLRGPTQQGSLFHFALCHTA